MKRLEQSIKTIKKAGFTHLKLELEASFGRFGSYYIKVPCDDCHGSGVITENKEDIECRTCTGEGYKTTDNIFTSEYSCEEFIMGKLSDEARNAIVYKNFYNDHSVDSELTFTVSIDNAAHCVEVINAFASLKDAIGRGIDVHGAGMHVTVMTSSRYPITEQLPVNKIRNFRKEVTKLLPALFIAASSGDFTRTLTYRRPEISHDAKYSAIYTHNNTCLEYRLFETCYQRPEALFEYIGTIAKTLEYYIDTSKKVATLGTEFHIYDNRNLKDYVATPDNLMVIRKTLGLVKPDGYTLSHISKTRNVSISLTDYRKSRNDIVKNIKKSYTDYVRIYNEKLEKMISQMSAAQEQRIREYTLRYPDADLELVKRSVLGIPEMESFEHYLQRNTQPPSGVAVRIKV